jgi:hypothetical protein
MGRLDGLPSLLHGETVTVLTPSTGYDEHGDEVAAWDREVVDNVLVAPGSTADVEDPTRPHGTRAVFTLGFPKAFDKRLRGCRVVVRCPAGGDEAKHTYSVIGDPQPNTLANCPTQWWYTAEVEDVDG